MTADSSPAAHRRTIDCAVGRLPRAVRRSSSCSARRCSACSSRRSCRARERFATQLGRDHRRPGRRVRQSPCMHCSRRHRGIDRPSPARSPSTAPDCSSRARSSCSPCMAVLLIAERSVEAAARSWRRPPSSSARRRDRELARTEPGADRGLPAALFAVGGMLIFPVSNNLLLMFVALEVLSLPLYLMAGHGPAPPAAVAGSRAEVLPARRVRVGVLPVRPRAALRLRQLRRPAGDPGGAQRTSSKSDVLLYLGLALLLVGLLFKASIAPFHSWTPDVYQARRRRSPRSWRRARRSPRSARSCACSTSGFASTKWDWRPIIWAVAIASMVVGAVFGAHPDRRQADPRLLLDRARRVHPGRHRGGDQGRHRQQCCSTC